MLNVNKRKTFETHNAQMLPKKEPPKTATPMPNRAPRCRNAAKKCLEQEGPKSSKMYQESKKFLIHCFGRRLLLLVHSKVLGAGQVHIVHTVHGRRRRRLAVLNPVPRVGWDEGRVHGVAGCEKVRDFVEYFARLAADGGVGRGGVGG